MNLVGSFCTLLLFFIFLSGCAQTLNSKIEKGKFVKTEVVGGLEEKSTKVVIETLSPTTVRLFREIEKGELNKDYYEKIEVIKYGKPKTRDVVSGEIARIILLPIAFAASPYNFIKPGLIDCQKMYGKCSYGYERDVISGEYQAIDRFEHIEIIRETISAGSVTATIRTASLPKISPVIPEKPINENSSQSIVEPVGKMAKKAKKVKKAKQAVPSILQKAENKPYESTGTRQSDFIHTEEIPLSSNGTATLNLSEIQNRLPKNGEAIVEYSYGGVSKVARITREDIDKAIASRIPPHLAIGKKVEFEGALKSGKLDAEESGAILVHLENDGKGTAWGVHLEVAGKYDGLEVMPYIKVGDILPGEKRTVRIPVRANLSVKNGNVDFKVQAKEQFGKDSIPRPLPAIAIKQADLPDLEIVSVAHSDSTSGMASGNSNGEVENGETIEFTVAVKNKGIGFAKGVSLKIDKAPLGAELVHEQAQLGNIPPGGVNETKLAVRLPKMFRAEGKEITVSFSATDRRPIARAASKGYAMAYFFNQPLIRVADLEIFDGDDRGGLSRGNRNHQIEQDETVEVRITVVNEGMLPAENVSISLGTDRSETRLTIDKKTVLLGMVRPGAKATAFFILDVPVSVDPGQLKLNIAVDQKDFPRVAKTETRTIYEAGHASVAEVAVVQLKAPAGTVREPAKQSENIDEVPFNPDFRRDNAYALVIGVSNYKNEGVTPLKYATADAETMRDYLCNLGGFSRGNVELLTDNSVTVTGINKELAKIKRKVGSDSSAVVMIFFSGHGVASSDAKPYLLMHDSDQKYVEETGYAIADLKKRLNELATKNTMIALDACYTGEGKSVTSGQKGLVRVEKDMTMTSATIINSSRENQASWEYPEKGHGIFTYFIFKGMRGAADHNGDSFVDADELFQYVANEVPNVARQKHGAEQYPVKLGNGAGIRLAKKVE